MQFHARSNDKNIVKNMFLNVFALNTLNALTDLKEKKENMICTYVCVKRNDKQI